MAVSDFFALFLMNFDEGINIQIRHFSFNFWIQFSFDSLRVAKIFYNNCKVIKRYISH